MHLGSSSVAGSGVPPARKSVDIIQGIQDAYTQIPSNVKKTDALKGLLQTAIQAKISVSTGSLFKSKKDEAGVIAAFRKALGSSSNADFRRDANAALDSLYLSNSSAGGGGGGGGAVSKPVVETKLSQPQIRAVVGGGAASARVAPRPPIDSVYGFGGGGGAGMSAPQFPITEVANSVLDTADEDPEFIAAMAESAAEAMGMGSGSSQSIDAALIAELEAADAAEYAAEFAAEFAAATLVLDTADEDPEFIVAMEESAAEAAAGRAAEILEAAGSPITDFKGRLAVSETLVVGAGYSEQEIERFSKFDPNYIGIGFGDPGPVLGSPKGLAEDWNSDINMFSSLVDSTLPKAFGSIRFDWCVQNCFTAVSEKEPWGTPKKWAIRPNVLPLLEILVTKIKPNGVVYLEPPHEEFGFTDTALANFFKDRDITVKEYNPRS